MITFMRQIIPHKRHVGPGKLKQFMLSFKPSNFKSYWISRKGGWRAARIIGHGILLLALAVLFVAKDLPSPSKINARVGAQTTKFYDRTGQSVLYEVFGNKNRSVIKFDQIPDNVKEATIAVEDKNFYRHGAFSTLSILRSAFTDLLHRGSGIQGGSTITQQYVKNALLSPEQTLTRKVRELLLSIILEQFYQKDDILSLYLNEIPYGTNAYGVQAAAKTYFDKDAKDLSLKQASILAAIPRAPTYYSPYGSHPDLLVQRQNLILDLMVEQKYATRQEADDAKLKSVADLAASVRATPDYFANITAPHFVFYVQEQLEAKYGAKAVTEGGLKVITTLDLKKQKLAEQAVSNNINGVRAFGGSNAALVSTDPKTGQMLAMVGSYDYNDQKFGAFNVATAERQPGSSFKPFAYATAFAKNYGPGSTLYDVPTDFGGGYKPHNFSNGSYGVVSMRQALGGSLNIPAVKTLYLAGIPETLNTAKNLGITTLSSPDKYGLSLVLGSAEVKPIEMANAYETFANGGYHHEQTTVLKVTDPSGKTLEEYKDKPPKQVMDPQVAYLISNILSDNPNRAFVFGCLLCMPDGRTVAIKTGTTESFHDAWTMGFTPSLVTAVWGGNNDNTPMSSAAANVSAPILKQYMAAALAGTPNEGFTRPPGLKEVKLDSNTGKLPGPDSKAQRTDLFPSWYKPTDFTQGQSAVVDKVSGKLATDCTPEAAKQTVFATDIHAEIPSTDPSYPRWEPPVEDLARRLGFQEGGTLPTEHDDVHKCSDVKPTINVSVQDFGLGYEEITAQVGSGTFIANKLDISVDDQIVSTQSVNGGANYSFGYHAGNGGHLVKATVTDSGYYQNSDSQNITVSGSGTFAGVAPSGGHSGAAFQYQWGSGLNSGVVYKIFVNNTLFTSTGTCCHANGTGSPIGADQWYVEAYDGSVLLAKSDLLSFTNP